MWKVLGTLSVAVAAAIPASGAMTTGFNGSATSIAWQPSGAAMQGTWTSDARTGWSDSTRERRWQFNLRSDNGDNSWGFGIRPADLQGAPAAALEGTASDVRFTWSRDAGVFHFSGSFDQGRGSGRFTFTASEPYLAAMRQLGYTIDAPDTMRLAVLDVTTAYVRELGDTGYSNLPLDELTRMRIHRVTAAGIREFKALGYDALSTEMLVRLRIHNVTPEFVRGLAARNYRGLLPDDVVRMRIHGVTLENVDELKALGFSGLGADELVKFRIHKVTPAYIREMHDVGFAAVTEDELVRMRIHRVDAQFVKDARADGYAMTTPGEAIDLAIRGPRYTRARRK